MNDLLKKPYAKRKFIVIAPEREKFELSKVDWEGAIKEGVAAINVTNAAWLYAKLIIIPIEFGVEVTKQLVISAIPKRFRPKRKVKLKNINTITVGVAERDFSFPVGHPLIDHVYVGHPLVVGRYLPLASFHAELFEEKMQELTHLLVALGARSIQVSCNQGYQKDYEGGIRYTSASIKSGSLRGRKRKTKQSKVEFEETYSPAEDFKPGVPDNLIWYDKEYNWQALVKKRMYYSPSTLKFELEYQDNFEIEAKLEMGLEKFGFKIGGAFQDFQVTNWSYEVDF